MGELAISNGPVCSRNFNARHLSAGWPTQQISVQGGREPDRSQLRFSWGAYCLLQRVCLCALKEGKGEIIEGRRRRALLPSSRALKPAMVSLIGTNSPGMVVNTSDMKNG